MTVYVDDFRARYGRMIMCHMIADTEAELHDFADHIGIARRHYQGDHYDICLAKKELARRFGAIEVTRRTMVRLRRDFRAGVQFGVPELSASDTPPSSAHTDSLARQAQADCSGKPHSSRNPQGGT